MADLDLMVERGQGPGERRRCVAMDENEIGLVLLEDALHAEERLAGDGGERLTLLHNVEIKIAVQMEDLHDGIEHLAVLPGQADAAFDGVARLQRLDQRGHLDGLGARAEDGHDLNFLHVVPPWAHPPPALLPAWDLRSVPAARPVLRLRAAVPAWHPPRAFPVLRRSGGSRSC